MEREVFNLIKLEKQKGYILKSNRDPKDFKCIICMDKVLGSNFYFCKEKNVCYCKRCEPNSKLCSSFLTNKLDDHHTHFLIIGLEKQELIINEG